MSTVLARAVLRNVADEQLGQGGSTITQQLVKNTYLTPEKTLQRKYAEAMLSFALERRLSKNDILRSTVMRSTWANAALSQCVE